MGLPARGDDVNGALGTASVLRANARSLPLADNTVDLIVTSPPYFALRSYQDGGEHYAGQIGDEPTPAEFVDSLIEVTRECMRVLKPSGSLWVNLGDKYSTGASGMSALRELGEQGYRGGGHTDAKAKRKTAAVQGMRPKSLVGVWSKPNGLPESVTDRVRRSHEQWFHFTLEPRYFAAVDEVREPQITADRKGPRHSYPPGSSSSMGVDGRHQPMVGPFAGLPLNPLGRMPGSVWSIASEPLRVPEDIGVDHFAAFPTEWPRRIIQGWSPAGVCVECGEGRRPTTSVDHATIRETNTTGRPKQQDLSGDRNNGWNRAGYPRISSMVTGYVCSCNEPIATPTGRAGEADPSLETGRGGLNRPRGDAEGTRVITMWEQRHEAQQLRESPHRAEMATAAGPAFAHYLRTDRSGARPIPEDLRTDWCARGWLQPAPPYTAPPTQPAVVLDPFGGTGTTAMVAKALGRHGITVDMSADYCRLGQWRTNDRDQLAKVLGVAKVEQQPPTQLDLFGELA